MKIVVLTGSPHKKGTSALLADRFIAGAQAAGHSVRRIDCAAMNIGCCKACEYCHAHDGVCVQKDDMAQITEEILAADAVVFAAPTYYFGIAAQLKRVIDRFYAVNDKLMGAGKRAALLLTCADTERWVAEPVVAHYQAICRYLGWQDCGCVVGRGLSVRADAERSEYPAQAEALGASL